MAFRFSTDLCRMGRGRRGGKRKRHEEEEKRQAGADEDKKRRKEDGGRAAKTGGDDGGGSKRKKRREALSQRVSKADAGSVIHREVVAALGQVTFESLEVAAREYRRLVEEGPVDPSLSEIERSPSAVEMLERAGVRPLQDSPQTIGPDLLVALEEMRRVAEEGCRLAREMSRLKRDFQRWIRQELSARNADDPLWRSITDLNLMLEKSGSADAETLANLEQECKKRRRAQRTTTTTTTPIGE